LWRAAGEGIALLMCRALAPVDGVCRTSIFRHVFHLSGGYQLPFGKDKRFMNTWKLRRLMRGMERQLDRDFQGANITSVARTGRPPNGLQSNQSPRREPELGIKVQRCRTSSERFLGRKPGSLNEPCETGESHRTRDNAKCAVAGNGVNILGGYATTTKGPGYHKLDFSTSKHQADERFLAASSAPSCSNILKPSRTSMHLDRRHWAHGVVSI